MKFYNQARGFGFIITTTDVEVFFHKSSVKSTGFRDSLLQGDQVQFELKKDRKGKRAHSIVHV